MTKGEVDYAIRKAYESFDRWNDSTGLIDKFSGYYYEALGEIENAVRIGIVTALHIDLQANGLGYMIYQENKKDNIK